MPRIILPVHTSIDSTGSSGLMEKIENYKTPIEIFRVRIGNLTRQFSEAAFYVEDGGKTFRTVDSGITVPPHDVWSWEGSVEGSKFKFEVKAVTSDEIFFRVWYRMVPR